MQRGSRLLTKTPKLAGHLKRCSPEAETPGNPPAAAPEAEPAAREATSGFSSVLKGSLKSSAVTPGGGSAISPAAPSAGLSGRGAVRRPRR